MAASLRRTSTGRRSSTTSSRPVSSFRAAFRASAGPRAAFEGVRLAARARGARRSPRPRTPSSSAFPPVLPRRDLERMRLPAVVPAPGRERVRLRGRRAERARAGGACGAPRGLERVPVDDRPRAGAGRLLPGLPGGRRARAAAAGRRHRRRRRRLRLPARTVRRPQPGCRCSTCARSSGSASPRRWWTGATCGATRALELLRGLGLDADVDVASDPFFGRQRADARREPARSRSSSSRSGVRSPAPSRPRSRRSTTTRTTSRPSSRHRPPPTASRRPHGLPRLRRGADRARPASGRTDSIRSPGRRRSGRGSGETREHRGRERRRRASSASTRPRTARTSSTAASGPTSRRTATPTS